MNLMHRTMLPLAATAAVAIAGACSDPSAGEALPIPDRTSAPDEPPASQSSPTNSSTALDTLDPCTLLTPAEIAEFDANPGERKDTTGARACDWTVPGGRGGFSVDLRSRQGLKDIVVGLGTLSDQPVGSHEGKLLKEDFGRGSCMVVIGIGESERVDVQGTANVDTAKACDYAMRVAGLVEPRLPKGE